MVTQTTPYMVIGGIRDWFSLKYNGDVEDVDDDSVEDDRPVVFTKQVDQECEYTYEETIERSVELIHFAQGGTLVVEYDSLHKSDGQLVFKSMSALTKKSGSMSRKDRGCEIQYDSVVSCVNAMAVSHREQLGTFDVNVSQPMKLQEYYELVMNDDMLPDSVKRSSGSIYPSRVRRPDGSDFDTVWGLNGFEVYGGDVVWQRQYTFKEFTGELVVEPEKTIGEVLSESVQGGTASLQAVSASGDVMLPNEDGDPETGVGPDITQIKALASDDPGEYRKS